MCRKLQWSALVLIGTLCLPGLASAEQVRFRFVPADAFGRTQQVPVGPDGAIGEKITGIGLIPKPYRENFRPTHMVTFRHPYTGRNVTVPMTLPLDKARLENRADRITYHFNGGYVIDVRFFSDGSVETFYNAGFLHQVRTP